MVGGGMLERFVHLIQIGEDVLATGQPSRSFSVNLVDSAMFEQWKTSVMSLLSATSTQGGVHFKAFEQKCTERYHSEAMKGLAILKAAKDDFGLNIYSAPPGQINIEDLPLHPRIAAVCVDLYQHEHYPNAVLDASKALIHFVKEKSGRYDLDGAPLMRQVFSKNDPILAFNDLIDQSDLDEQEGMMHIYEGVALGIRNPRGHGFPEDSPERALEYIGLISLLINRLEETHKP